MGKQSLDTFACEVRRYSIGVISLKSMGLLMG